METFNKKQLVFALEDKKNINKDIIYPLYGRVSNFKFYKNILDCLKNRKKNECIMLFYMPDDFNIELIKETSVVGPVLCDILYCSDIKHFDTFCTKMFNEAMAARVDRADALYKESLTNKKKAQEQDSSEDAKRKRLCKIIRLINEREEKDKSYKELERLIVLNKESPAVPYLTKLQMKEAELVNSIDQELLSLV